MSDKRFTIIFTGSIKDGYDASEVKQKAKQIFKMGDDQVTQLFSGKPTILKKNIDTQAAKKYQTILSNVGMLTRVHPVQSPQQPSAAPTKQEVSTNASLRLLSNEEVIESIQYRQSSAQQGYEVVAPSWDLREAGEWLVDHQATDSHAVELMFDQPLEGVTLAPVAADLSDPDGQAIIDELVFPTQLADMPIDSVTLSSPGEDLLTSTERYEPIPVSVDTDYLSAETMQGDLLLPEEKSSPIHREINTSHLKLHSIGDE